MHNKKLPIAIFAISAMVFLAGCQSGAKTTTRVDVATDQSQQTEDISPDLQQPAATNSATNTAASNAALQLNDPKFCDKISDETAKKQCMTDLSDQSTSSQAHQKMDASLCDKLSTKDKQGACKIEVEVLLKKQQEKDAFNAQLASNKKLMESISKNDDYTKCKNLSGENPIRDCEVNILSDKAIKAKDESWCDKASTESAKTICHGIYKLGVN